LAGISAGQFSIGNAICPDCHTNLRVVNHGITDLDYCFTCHGVFFDKGEFEFVTREMTINPRDIELGAATCFGIRSWTR
jgi:Zn-finger nucleic acid-binding protein